MIVRIISNYVVVTISSNVHLTILFNVYVIIMFHISGYPQIETDIQRWGFENYTWFTGAFCLCLLICSCALAGLSFVYDKRRNVGLPISIIRQPEFIDRDSKYALDTIGDDSVYQFFLGNSIVGWIIVLLTMALQVWMLSSFVEGSEIDLSDDQSDLVYTYKCPRDDIDCNDTSDLNWRGWTVFGVLMVAHVLKDIINVRVHELLLISYECPDLINSLPL